MEGMMMHKPIGYDDSEDDIEALKAQLPRTARLHAVDCGGHAPPVYVDDVEDDGFITVESMKAQFRRAGVVARIKHVLVVVSGVALDRMVESSSLADDLELDSLERIEAGQAFEEEFGIALSDDEVDQACMSTIGGIADYLMTQRAVA
jgi:acyl carrier protein